MSLLSHDPVQAEALNFFVRGQTTGGIGHVSIGCAVCGERLRIARVGTAGVDFELWETEREGLVALCPSCARQVFICAVTGDRAPVMVYVTAEAAETAVGDGFAAGWVTQDGYDLVRRQIDELVDEGEDVACLIDDEAHRVAAWWGTKDINANI